MPKFQVGEICLIIHSYHGPVPPIECEITAILPNREYDIFVPGYPSWGHKELWSAPEAWLRKKPLPGSDIVKDLIKNMPLSLIDDLKEEEEKCTVKIIK